MSVSTDLARCGVAVWSVLFGSVALAQAALELPAQGHVAVAFSPWDDPERLLIERIEAARRTIYIQAYVLTSRTLAEHLMAAARRGVKIEIVADRDKTLNDQFSQLPKLAAAGIGLWLDGHYAAAHNKIMLLDPESTHPVVITGSYNFSYAARARNAENLLVLSGHPALTQAYLRNWQRHRAQSVAFAEAVRESMRPDVLAPTRKER